MASRRRRASITGASTGRLSMPWSGGRLVSFYLLKDPRTQQVRYIGQTTWTLAKRLREHCYEARFDERQPKCQWIAELHQVGLKPLIEEIETAQLDYREMLARESRWMASFQAAGAVLLNIDR